MDDLIDIIDGQKEELLAVHDANAELRTENSDLKLRLAVFTEDKPSAYALDQAANKLVSIDDKHIVYWIKRIATLDEVEK